MMKNHIFILIFLVSLLNSYLNAANGLTGQYYKNNDYTNQQLTRIDDVIDFNWGNSRPTNKVGNDNYSIIWSGYIYIPENANYTFYVAHDDFISVSINGVSRYSNGTWTGGNTNYNTFTINNMSSGYYPIEIRFREYSGGAYARFGWKNNASISSQVIVPTTNLFTEKPSGPSFSITDSSLIEGNSGYSDMNFTVTISEPANASVQYRTSNGTATSGNDYTYKNGVLNFTADGNTSQTISIPIRGDTEIEQNEQFYVTLSNPQNATIANATATGMIENDDMAYCGTNALSDGFHVINPFNDVNKSIEIFCYDKRDFIALPIKNSSNNFVFNNNTLTSTNYYNEASNNGRHFQAIEINAYTLEVLVDSTLRAPQTINASTSFQTMGSSFSNINLTGTPFRIDWDNTTISNCTEAKLRKAYYGQDVKINTLNYDNKAICNIDTMKLKLLDDYRYLEYQNKEVLQKSCKTMAEAVPKSFLNPSTIKGHYWISPYSHERTYNSTNIKSDERPIVVYCWYQSDLNWVWTFSLAMDGKVTNKKSDLTNKRDTCSEFGLVPFVPNREDTFERVRAFLYDKKSEWVNYTGTIDEKIKTFKGSGSSYYLSTEQNSLIWPYGSFGVYFPTSGNTPQTWGAGTTTPAWMSGSPMHNISSITKDYERLNNDENVASRDYYSHGHYSSTDTIAATNEYTYKDTMGYKGWVSILGSSDLNKTNEWFISRTGAGDNFSSTSNYPYYEPNGNYTAEAWLNYLFDSNGRVRHNDDWNDNYPYYDYMCMAEDNYDFYTPYDTTTGPFTVIEHGQTIYHGLSKASLDTTGALEILCQSGSILHTQGLNNGISDRHRGDITTNT